MDLKVLNLNLIDLQNSINKINYTNYIFDYIKYIISI